MVSYENNELMIDGLSLKDLGEEFGTPLFLYSAKTIRENFLSIKKAFAAADPLIAYSVKANTNGAARAC